MYAALVTETTAGFGASSGVDTSAADFLVSGITGYNQFGYIAPTFSDNMGNSYFNTIIGGDSTSIGQATIMYSQDNPTVGSGHTFTTGGVINAPAHVVQAFSGAAASPLDGMSAAGSSSSITSIQPGSITPTQDNELFVTMLAECDDAHVPTIDSGFIRSSVFFLSAGNYYGGAFARLIQGAAAAVNPTWSWTSNVATQTAVAMASFKAAGTVTATYKSRGYVFG